MGWFDFLKKKKAPPEQLVLSAKLRCPNSLHKACSYLWVDADVIDVNNLPQANVDDYIPQKNILSFGLCKARDGKACDMYMEFDKPWTNPEPQGLLVNGKEAITTDSILQCKNADAPIEILSSGQDPIAASQFIFRMEMDKKYPGLRAILDDPNASLYLNKGKYEMALQFLEYRMEKNGGAISLYRLGDKDPEIYYIGSALAHLVPGLRVERLGTFADSFDAVMGGYDEATQKTIDNHSLNEAMLDLLKKVADDNNRKIQAGGLYKGQEENKEFLANLAEIMKAAVYIALAKGSSGGKGESGTPSSIKYDSKQVGKKWGKHRTDYPNMHSYNDYQNYANKLYKTPDKIIYDERNKEYLYIKGDDLLRIGENGDFISMYPGAESSRVIDAIKNGGLIWPQP